MRAEDYPALFRAANEAAATAQSKFLQLFGCNLVLFVIVGAISASNSKQQWAWFLCGFLLLINFSITIAIAIFKPERDWYAARAIAESVKTATWRFASRAEPFHDDFSDQALREFQKRLRDIFEQNKSFSRKFSSAIEEDQIPNSLLEYRKNDLPWRIGFYRDHRVIDQKIWYSKKSRFNRRSSTLWLALTLLVTAFAIGVHFYRANQVLWSYWPGDILITLALSLLAWTQTKRFRELAESYTLATLEISLIEIALHAVKSEKDFSNFVIDAENAFSREHTQWAARKDH